MAEQNRTVLKSYFETGDVPTQAQFGDFIDSAYNKTDDTASSIGAQATLVSGTNIKTYQGVSLLGSGNLLTNVTVTDTVPANGALANGTFAMVVNSTVGRELYVGDASNNPVPACGYKTYVALLSQTGTSAPTATVLKNTLGSVSFEYIGVGIYRITTTSLFTSSKTLIANQTYAFTGDDGVRVQTRFSIVNESRIDIETLEDITFINGTLSSSPIEIRVYA